MANAGLAIVVGQPGALARSRATRPVTRTEDQVSNRNPQLEGPDLTTGVELETLSDETILAGHVGNEAVLLIRRDNEVVAIGATCTHYGGPLAKGLLVDGTVRCPWHHACFDLRSGEPLRAPALDPLPRWRVEVSNGIAVVREKLPRHTPSLRLLESAPQSILIVGGGAAANAAAETLRRESYGGPITMLSADGALPCDRPNLSKDYLAGKAPEEWTVLRSADFYEHHGIDVELNARVTVRGTPATSAIPRRTIVHSTPTVRVSSLRSTAW